MSKILIAEDNAENMAAAQKAALLFPGHTFVFSTKGSEALALLPDADAVITGFFMEPEEGEMADLHEEYVWSIDHPASRQEAAIRREIFSDLNEAYSSLNSVSRATCGRYQGYADIEKEWLERYHCYGAILMQRAVELGKGAELLTNLYRICVWDVVERTGMPVSGARMLLPLMVRGIIPERNLNWGGPRLSCGCGYPRGKKDQVETWQEAIEKVLKTLVS